MQKYPACKDLSYEIKYAISIFVSDSSYRPHGKKPDIVLCKKLQHRPGPEAIKHFSCSTQLSTKFQLLIKTKMPTNK